MGFNLLKALGLQRFADRALDGFKVDITREIDRAICKLEDGQTVPMVTDNLHHIIAELLAKAPLPPPLGGILASMLMLVDWEGLARKPSGLTVIRELERLKRQIEGARL